MRRSVIGTKTARRIADICVTTTSIVDVNNRLGVDIGEVVHWSLFQKLESTYTNTGLREARSVSVGQSGKQQTFQAVGLSSPGQYRRKLVEKFNPVGYV